MICLFFLFIYSYQTNLQEVISHKRVVEAVTEKAQALVQLTNDKEGGKEVQETVNSINKRYEELVNNLLVTIT